MDKAKLETPLISIIFALFLSGMGILAMTEAFRQGREVETGLGSLIFITGIIEFTHAFRRASSVQQSLAWKSATISIILGIFIHNAPDFDEMALAIFMAAFLLYELIRYLRAAKSEGEARQRQMLWIAAAAHVILIALLLAMHRRGIDDVLSIGITIRIFGVAGSILAAKLGQPRDLSQGLIEELKLSDNREIADLAVNIEKEGEARARMDRYWVVTLLMLLFFIHLGRMGFDRSFMGILSPLAALFGDMVFAIMITFVIIAPTAGAFHTATGKLETLLWKWVQKVPAEQRMFFSLRGLIAFLLKENLSIRLRMRKARYSYRVAIRTGLKTGLPIATLLTAIIPVLGMSWYFDTENLASGIWNGWSGRRTDIWRTAMTLSTGVTPSPSAFRLNPEGVTDSTDFSFIVVGDPGEGDASQLVLKDQIIKASEQPEVKFLLILSDVIYPAGAMKDYEHKFYLPYKGVTKPVYAIPGNHDWFDALEGFVANFYTPEAARKAMDARIDKDLRVSSSTQKKIDEMIRQAAFLRNEYQVLTGFQQTPYFQISNDRFLLLCIDTGVKMQVDSLQLEWVKQVLEDSKGKFVMALLGHPFYAGGQYQGHNNPIFEQLHALLRRHKVSVVMAGDTHDMEYYLEPPKSDKGYPMHHFVNGGGGAYLSIGTAMSGIFDSSIKEYAYYPSKEPLVKKIEANANGFEDVAWWYTRKFEGWPFSVEWLSAAFDYNVAPFFQSFMEIRVEPSAKRVRFIPYSQHGRLRWSDITSTPGLMPAGTDKNEWVEWLIPMQ
jgi:uncharacterized membrane protein HdeD (DUF308 family)